MEARLLIASRFIGQFQKPPFEGFLGSSPINAVHGERAHPCFRIPLDNADCDMRGDETSSAGEQYALCLVLALLLRLALGQGAGNAVCHSNHCSRVLRDVCSCLPSLRQNARAPKKLRSGQLFEGMGQG